MRRVRDGEMTWRVMKRSEELRKDVLGVEHPQKKVVGNLGK